MKRLAALALGLSLLAPALLIGCGGEGGSPPAEASKADTPKGDGEAPKTEATP